MATQCQDYYLKIEMLTYLVIRSINQILYLEDMCTVMMRSKALELDIWVGILVPPIHQMLDLRRSYLTLMNLSSLISTWGVIIQMLWGCWEDQMALQMLLLLLKISLLLLSLIVTAMCYFTSLGSNTFTFKNNYSKHPFVTMRTPFSPPQGYSYWHNPLLISGGSHLAP